MKLELNNLAALVQGREMNLYQRSLAIAEFQSVIEFLQQLENTEQANGVEQSPSNCNIPPVSGSVLTDLDYWKIRCKLSEAIEAASPCDPDITTEQINAYSDYNKFIERYGTDR